MALEDLAGKRRCLIVTGQYLFDNGFVDEPIRLLKKMGLEVEVFFEVPADPTLAVVRKGADLAHAFKPDVIMALGGGSPMDAAKIIWVMYEHPEVHFEDLALRFMDIRKRIYQFPKLGQKALMVAVPTTSGTGSEVTPFAVVTDENTGVKYPIADYELTPNMAIVDANLVMNMPVADRLRRHRRGDPRAGGLCFGDGQRVFGSASLAGLEAAQGLPAVRLPQRRR